MAWAQGTTRKLQAGRELGLFHATRAQAIKLLKGATMLKKKLKKKSKSTLPGPTGAKLGRLQPGDKEYEELMKPKQRNKLRVKITPKALIKAIKGSAGSITEIAKRLLIRRTAVGNCLKRAGPEWDLVRKAYESEVEGSLDVAEKTIHFLVTQRKDLGEAGKNARWILERRRRQIFGEKKSVEVSGGDKPIRQELVTIDALNGLPNDLKREILEHIEKAEASADNKKDEDDES